MEQKKELILLHEVKNIKHRSSESYMPSDFLEYEIYTDGRDIFCTIGRDKEVYSYDPIVCKGWCLDKHYVLSKVYRKMSLDPIENTIKFIGEIN